MFEIVFLGSLADIIWLNLQEWDLEKLLICQRDYLVMSGDFEMWLAHMNIFVLP